MDQVDLNSDLGESFGPWVMGHDREMFEVITSANIACGLHGGDPLVMHRTLTLARENGVGVGAHPGHQDIWGFGRRLIAIEPEEAEKLLIYQIGAIQAMARAVGVPVTHVKVHGALANQMAANRALAQAAARAVGTVDPTLIFVALSGTEQERAAREAGLRVAREVFADRAYEEDGMLVSRTREGAVLHDAAAAAARIVRMVREQAVTAITGREIPLSFETICVHGDNPAAVAMARQVRSALEAEGVAVRPMAEWVF
jgi:5-oxoprolinase (ATP-hydrolysing) subunit A